MFQIKFVYKIKTRILCSVTFSENLTVYEIMSKNVVESGRQQTTRRMRVACCVTRATREQAHARAYALTYPPTHTEI